MLQQCLGKRSFGNKDDKISFLLPLMDASKHYEGYFVTGEHKELFLQHQKQLLDTGKTQTKRRDDWSSNYVSQKIVEIYILIDDAKKSNKLQQRSRVKAPFDKLVKAVSSKFETFKNEQAAASMKKKRTSLNLQVSGRRLQDGMTLSSPDAEACPQCGHMSTMAVCSVTEIRQVNQSLKAGHDRQLQAWQRAGAVKGQKPKAPNYQDVMIGCFCFQQHCSLQPNGGNCYACKAIVSSNGTMDSLLEADERGNLSCACHVCSCTCAAAFKQSDRHKILLEKRKTERLGATAPNQQNSAGHLRSMLNEHMGNAALVAGQDSSIANNPQAQQHHAASLASILIAGDAGIQTNSNMRRNVQKALGPLSRMTTTGLNVNTLRQQQGHGMSASAAPSNVPIDAVARRDSRFHRNRLNQQPNASAASIRSMANNQEVIEIDVDDDRKPAPSVTTPPSTAPSAYDTRINKMRRKVRSDVKDLKKRTETASEEEKEELQQQHKRKMIVYNKLARPSPGTKRNVEDSLVESTQEAVDFYEESLQLDTE
ncbi:MAG: hypothetical protein SGARI_001093 [Bacillariaceae sp.]